LRDRWSAATGLDQADNGLGILGENRRAALAQRYGMAEEEDVSRRRGFLKMGRFVERTSPEERSS